MSPSATLTTDANHELKARVRRSLPTLPLESIRIASPCTASWAAMRGDERSRHCEQCQKTVHDLSKMTRAEAEALVSADGPAPCVRLWVRTDGTVLTQDCPVGLAKLRRHLRRLGAAFGALLGALVGLAGCTRDASPASGSPGGAAGLVSPQGSSHGDGEVLMGKVCAPSVAPPDSTTPAAAR